MKKKLFKMILGIVVGSSLLFSSCNFLDVDQYFEATFKEDSIFHSKKNAEGYLWNTPKGFPDPGAIWGGSWNPGESASDEITVRWQTSEFWGAQFSVGQINSRNLPNSGLWYNMYVIVSRCNKMLKEVWSVPDMNDMDRRRYIGYVHFMRAYAYYHLLMNWGPLLIVGDEVLSTSESAEYYNRERSTYDESVDYVCEEFRLAALGIYSADEQSVNYYTRPTKGAALAFIARLRLFQASPLFNGGDAARRCFGNWQRKSDGAFYINQQYDPTRWAVAAAAAKQLTKMGYSLHTVEADPLNPYPLAPNVPNAKFPNGAGGIDPLHSFADMFNGESIAQTNKELIWGMPSSNVTNYTVHSFPVKFGGWGGMSVPQRVVDCFLMADGKTIENANDENGCPYNPDFSKLTGEVKKLGDYVLKENVPLMYANRSARFYASIGFPGRVWPMSSAATDASYSNKQFWYSHDDMEAGIAGAGSNINDYCVSGYVPVKYIHPDDSWANGKGSVKGAFVTSPKTFPVIRYAEVLLEYVEALNNVEGPVTVEVSDETGTLIEETVERNVAEMAKYFNMIRYRVGLPGVSPEDMNVKSTFEQIIRNERQVELFNEGYRYFDTRRWGTYLDEDANTSNWRGMDVQKDRTSAGGNEGFWNTVTINTQNVRDRVAQPKMVFLPLRHDELLKVPNMDQNYGWDR